MKHPILKKLLFVTAFFLLTVTITKAQNNKKPCPYYYTRINNPTKTVNFLLGLYTTCYLDQLTASDSVPYTRIKAAIINDGTNDLKWNNYKVYILLKSGELIRNYTTAATDGDYACTYVVSNGATHHQYFCFHSTFTSDDISKVWFALAGDDQLFDLEYADDK